MSSLVLYLTNVFDQLCICMGPGGVPKAGSWFFAADLSSFPLSQLSHLFLLQQKGTAQNPRFLLA